MTAEEVALQQFRAAVINLRVARKIRNADTFGLWFAVTSLARIIRAIRRENRGDQMRASYEASVSEHVIHAETAWYDRGYEQGIRDMARRVQGACLFEMGRLEEEPRKYGGSLWDWEGYREEMLVHDALSEVVEAVEEAAR